MIEGTLGRFREYLAALHAPVEAPAAEPPAFEWATLAAQFTALRHDVNLQTKAVRTAVEAFTTEKPKTPSSPADPSPTGPWLESILDIAHTLSLAAGRAERTKLQLEAQAAAAADSHRTGFWSRLFAGSPPTPAAPSVVPLVAGLADGYAMSVRRVEKLIAEVGLEPIVSASRPFDPGTMEAVEAVAESGRPAGTVIEEVRKGYRRGDRVFRFAQVKVAR